MRKKPLLLLPAVLFFFITADTHAYGQQWEKYVAKNKRKSLLRDAAKATGMGMVFSGQAALAIWITDPVARVLVSQAVDAERLTPEEADQRYAELRPKETFLFLLDARRIAMGMRPVSGKELSDPLAKKEIFLQRADDPKQFAKGEVREQDFEVNLGGLYAGSNLASTYYITFPKTTRDDKPYINSLEDKIEFQFVISRKKVVLEYKLKDLVSRLEDL